MIPDGRLWRVAPEIVTLTWQGGRTLPPDHGPCPATPTGQDEEQILFNPENFLPVYLPEGGTEVQDLLRRFGQSVHAKPPDSHLCPEDLFQFLWEHALIVPPAEEEFTPQSEQVGCAVEGAPSRRVQLFLILSHQCNLACVYCLDGERTCLPSEQRILTLETAQKAMETFWARLAPGGALEVVFFGGEPLLHWPLARRIMQFGTHVLQPRHPDKRIQFSITTNLYHMPDGFPEEARQNDLAILVNVDGPASLHDRTRPARGKAPSFARIVNNLRRLTDAGVPVDLRATITDTTVAHMVEVAACHREIGGASSALLPLNPIDSDGAVLPAALYPAPEAFAHGLEAVFHAGVWPVAQLYPFNEYQNRLKPGFRLTLACGATEGQRPVVTPDGQLHACHYLVKQPRFSLGTVAAEDFPRPEAVARLRAKINPTHRPHCHSCGYRYLCGGGCPLGLFATGTGMDIPAHVTDYMEQLNCAITYSVVNTLLWHLCRNLK
jgi:uncharacterized protein